MFSITYLQARLKAAPSIREVARRSGVSEKTIHRLKAGDYNTSIDTANKVIKALDDMASKQPKATA